MSNVEKDIQPQWQAIADWYWDQCYVTLKSHLTIWQILARDHGVQRVRPMGHPGWSRVRFPSQQAYTWFLLRWS